MQAKSAFPQCGIGLLNFKGNIYSTGHSQRNMLTNLFEQIRSFANKNEGRVNEFIKIRKNEVTTSFLIHKNEFAIPNSW